MIFNSDSYDALMAMEEARTGHYGEDYFDNGRPDDYWDEMCIRDSVFLRLPRR